MYKCLSLADYLDVQDLVWDWVLVAELLLTQSLRSELVAATFSLAETLHNQGSGKHNSSFVFCHANCWPLTGVAPDGEPLHALPRQSVQVHVHVRAVVLVGRQLHVPLEIPDNIKH